MQVVQVVLDVVEVAVVLLGDLLRDVPLADPVDVVGGHVQGADQGVQHLVDAVDQELVITLRLDIGPG